MRNLVATAFVLVFLAAGCTGDDPVAAPTSTTTASTTATVPPQESITMGPAPTTSTSAAGGTVEGGAASPPAPAPAADCNVPAGYPEPWPDRPYYSAQLTVEPAKRLVTGQVSVAFTPDADTDRLVFRLWANAPRIGRAGGRIDITTAQVAGQPVTGRYEAGGALAGRPGTIFVLPGTFPAGQRVQTWLQFRITLPGAINDRIAVVGRAVRLGSVIPTLSWIRGEGWQTSTAVNLNAEAAASEVADWDVTVSAPAGYTTLASSTGSLGGTPVDEDGSLPTTGFLARAVRDWAATVAPMRLGEAPAQGGKTTVVVGVAEGATGDPNALAARHARALDQLAARFGEYPYPQLTIGVTTGLSGGIEFPGHIFLGSGVPTVHLVHEVAHQWFYGLAGNDQYRDPWLDESFATYGQSRVDGQLAYQRSRVLPAYGRGHLGESMAYWGRADGSTYYLSVYVGGTQALAKLGDQLGGYGPLDCAIRRYVHDRAYTVSRPADFLAAVRAQSGVDPAPILAPFGIR
jgi:hypothetical protein